MSSAWDGLLNTPSITELPHYAINNSKPEDAFFTRRRIAERCVRRLREVCRKQGMDISHHQFLEPSAGEGCFYDFLPPGRRLGLDIRPQGEHIQQADFLRWWPSPDSGPWIAAGNPPFGVRGALALAFVNRSLLFADMVAFILPMSFYSNGKGSNMKRVRGAGLVHSEKLPPDAFYLPGDDSTASVQTVFQIWRKGVQTQVFTDYDISEYASIHTCCSAPDRYCGLGRGRQYDCFIASTFYKNIGLVRNFDEVLYGSGYGIIIRRKKREIMRLLAATDWAAECSDATNHCKHLRMYHLRKVLGRAGYGRPV